MNRYPIEECFYNDFERHAFSVCLSLLRNVPNVVTNIDHPNGPGQHWMISGEPSTWTINHGTDGLRYINDSAIDIMCIETGRVLVDIDRNASVGTGNFTNIIAGNGVTVMNDGCGNNTISIDTISANMVDMNVYQNDQVTLVDTMNNLAASNAQLRKELDLLKNPPPKELKIKKRRTFKLK